MAIKILGGTAKGLTLKVPPETITRPTLATLKRKPFDARQDWSDWHVIDLCAGSGALGLEAWSRGAASVVLVESNRTAFQCLSSNVQMIRQRHRQESEMRRIETVNGDAGKWLQRYSEHAGASENVAIFFDPPYEELDLYKSIALQMVLEAAWFQGEFWPESDDHKGWARGDWPAVTSYFELVREYRQGTSFILCYQNKNRA